MKLIVVLMLSLFACANGSIDGQVTLVGASDAPRGSVQLTGRTTRTATIAPDGTWAFAGLPDGAYKLKAVVPSTATTEEQVVIDSRHLHASGTLVVDAAGTITGTVTAVQNPFGGAEITVADTGQQTTSGDDGTFEIPLVPAGSHWLHVTPHLYGAIDTATFEVRYGQTTQLPTIDFEPDLTQSGAIRGRVVLTGVGPVQGARVSLSGHVVQSMDTDVNGYFAFTALPGGNYTITVALANTVEGEQVRRNVLVDADEIEDVGTISFTPL